MQKGQTALYIGLSTENIEKKYVPLKIFYISYNFLPKTVSDPKNR